MSCCLRPRFDIGLPQDYEGRGEREHPKGEFGSSPTESAKQIFFFFLTFSAVVVSVCLNCFCSQSVVLSQFSARSC